MLRTIYRDMRVSAVVSWAAMNSFNYYPHFFQVCIRIGRAALVSIGRKKIH
jgi:hypothetical protein